MIADEDVRERVKPDREREGSKHAPARGEAGPEGGGHESFTRGGVEEREDSAERGGGKEGTAENVLCFLTAGLAGGGAREEHRENRRRQEEGDTRERRRRAVRTGVVARETCLDDQDVDVRHQGDADEAHCDRPEVGQEGTKLGARHRRFAAARNAHERQGERGRCDSADERRDDRPAQAVSGSGEACEDHEPDEKWKGIHRGERVETLKALQAADCNRKDQRCRQRRLCEEDHAGGVDVQQMRERNRECERDGHERCRRERSQAKRRRREGVRTGLLAGSHST